MKKTVLSHVFSSVLALFLALLLLALSLAVFANSTLVKPEFLTGLAQYSGYTQALCAEIEEDWENLLAITGIADPEPILAVLTKEQVSADVCAYLEDSYTGTASINTTELEEKLDTQVRAYVLTILPDETIDKELEKNINELVSACIKDYKNSVRVPALPKILQAISKLGTLLEPAIWIAAAGCAVIAVFIFFLQRKRQYVLYYAAIATATNATLFLCATGLAAHYQLASRLPIGESALRTLLCALAQDMLDRLQMYGYFFLVASALLVLVYLLITVILKTKSRKA